MGNLRNIALVVTLTLTGCSSVPLGFLGGGGPNVAANTQIGRENNQTAVSVETGPKAERDVVTKAVEAQQVENVVITNERIPVWVFIALVVGWVAPTPSQIGQSIGRGIMRLFTRKRE